ncbi:MAG: aminotransferase class V-fold PLP-dependent enzyme, partial [Clostridia bacterium]|nr:aminotransferase class V-fold PLP-dependent enzyme [Clostridia bacterium]
AGEHAAIYASFTELKNRGVEPRFAPVHRDGSVDAEALLSLVDEKTSFVSVVHVNNETGAVNDIAKLARLVKAKNPRTVFHSDGVQAFGKLPVRISGEIDLYSLSAHKIGGAKGTGALVKRKKLALQPYLFGGGQENGLRSGTENGFGIDCFRYAAEEKFRTLKEDAVRLEAYREALWTALEQPLFTRISPENGSPYILTVSAGRLRGEVLQRKLWDSGIAVGTGSACSSKKPHSRVITACGYGADVLDGVLRVSFSSETTKEEVILCAQEMNRAAREMKEITG